MRAFFEALNAACMQSGPPGQFAWKGIYNDAGLAQEMDGLYGAGRVLSGVEGHGPGPRMHVHLDVRPLTVPFDDVTGFWLDGSRVVLAPPPPRATVSVGAGAARPACALVKKKTQDSPRPCRAAGAAGSVMRRSAATAKRRSAVERRARASTPPAGEHVDVGPYICMATGRRRADFLARKAAAAGVDLVEREVR